MGILTTKATVVDYQSMRDMDEPGVAQLDEKDMACLSELGTVLVRNGAHRHIGVTHNHRHFDFEPGEGLLKNTCSNGQTFTSGPAASTQFDSNNVRPSQVLLRRTCGNEVALLVVEHEMGDPTDGMLEVTDAAIWGQLIAVLEKHSRVDRFGFGAIAHLRALAPDQVYLEQTILPDRVLYYERVHRDDARIRSGAPETFWRFAIGDSNDSIRINAGVCCWSTPYGHQRQHNY